MPDSISGDCRTVDFSLGSEMGLPSFRYKYVLTSAQTVLSSIFTCFLCIFIDFQPEQFHILKAVDWD